MWRVRRLASSYRSREGGTGIEVRAAFPGMPEGVGVAVAGGAVGGDEVAVAVGSMLLVGSVSVPGDEQATAAETAINAAMAMSGVLSRRWGGHSESKRIVTR